MADQQVIEAKPEFVEAEVVKVKGPKPFYLKPKFIASAILLMVIIGLVIWMIQVFSVYREAKVYKNAYDITQEQFQYCEKIANEKAEKKYFDYCDELKSRYKSVTREGK